MATCKDCIHYELCQHNEYKEAQYFGKDKEIYITIKNNMTCIYFKPKSDYERKRGEWVKHKPDPKVMDEFHKLGIGRAMNRNSIFWTCSCCGTWGTPTHKFCSECGAYMRKEDNNA